MKVVNVREHIALVAKRERALAILQAAIDRDRAQRRMRHSHGYSEKPLMHDELQAAIARNTVPPKPRAPYESDGDPEE
jgi:hypothetical protein